MTSQRWFLIGLVLTALALGGCNSSASTAPKVEAITIEEDGGTGLKTLTLSDKAAQRLGVETVAVAGSGAQMSIPYAAVVYDAQGQTWAYVAQQPLVYRRAQITVQEIDGDVARISAGPASGSQVVTTGAAELYGAEIGVGGGH
jgi:hypothetical protein